MRLFCLVLMICCLGLLIKMSIQKKQINHIKTQIDFLCSRDTQAQITLARVDKSTERLAESINRLLERYHDMGQQIQKKNALFKDTITSLSHDLRTPLATANGYIQLLMEQELSPEQQEYAEIAYERMSAVKILLGQLFEFARIEANELMLMQQRTDLNSLLRDVLAMYYSDFEKKAATLDIRIPDTPFIIWADKEALCRVFSNLIYNALIHGDNEYKIISSHTEKSYQIIVSNHSETICKEDIPHLFDRFYTTDQSRSKKTTGLGLAIAKKLTIKMGGCISAHLHDKTFDIQITFPAN
ncbi:MAG: HAMP domain-containing histidine kinase [Eubacterium sp.]|nr:HAMP domain-containing histidine kinase [Eubacterium sp.]